MALSIYKKQFVKFATVEKADAFVVVAILFETNGSETYAISEPKVVKIIAKKNFEISNGHVSQGFILPAPVKEFFRGVAPVKSPFFSTIFGFTNADVVVGLNARPPTF